MNKLSVILPAYNECKNIEYAAKTISSILVENDIQYEIIFIDDGSKDETWREIKRVKSSYKNIKGISFSKNFGKEAAIFAGLKYCKGDCCVVLDTDLQHPPIKIIEMYQLWLAGYEVIEGVKSNRGKESFLHRFAANSFYSLISKATHVDMSNASDFKLLDRKVINELLEFKERDTFFRALSSWVGFKSTSVEYEVQDRIAGNSKWSTKSLFKYAISNITSFSSSPTYLVIFFGILVLIISIILSLNSLMQYFSGKALGGFTTVIIIQLFIASVTMISLGIIGYYIGKIYDEIKERPRYIISEEIGDENN